MTAKRLDATYFSDLLEYLQGRWPESLMVYNMVKVLQYYPSAGFHVWVDQWPSPKVVLVNADQDNCMFDCWRSYVLVYTKDQSAFIKMMFDVVIPDLDDKRTILLPGLSRETASTIKLHFPNHASNCIEFQMMWLKSADCLKENFSTLPFGFKHGCMTKTAAEVLVGNMHTDWISFTDVEAVYKSATQLECPSVVIFDSNDSPVGWYIKHCLLGFLSHLYVLEKYRGQGIGKYLVSNLSQSVLCNDNVAFVQISSDNLLSTTLHEHVGFERVGAVFYCVLKPK